MTQWGFSTNGNEVVDAFADRVKGKTIVITGPSIGGIGAETALSLSRAFPALIVLVGRSASKITPLISQIKEVNPSGSVKFVVIELDSQASVRKAAAEINDSVEKIDYLINNAGIMACPNRKTEDGIESQFATNHIGHFLLTNLLMGKILKAGKGARIINVSSAGHLGGMKWDWYFDDDKTYEPFEAYGQSKAANIMFTQALAKKLNSRGIFSFTLNPGSIASNLQKYMNYEDKEKVEKAIKIVREGAERAGSSWEIEKQKTLQQGCATTLVAALDPSLEGHNGAYLNNGNIAMDMAAPETRDEKNVERLWAESEKLPQRLVDSFCLRVLRTMTFVAFSDPLR